MKKFIHYILEYNDKERDPKEESNHFLYRVIRKHEKMAVKNPELAKMYPEALTADLRTAIWRAHHLTMYPNISGDYDSPEEHMETIKRDAPHLYPVVAKALGIKEKMKQEPKEVQGEFDWGKPKSSIDKPGTDYYKSA